MFLTQKKEYDIAGMLDLCNIKEFYNIICTRYKKEFLDWAKDESIEVDINNKKDWVDFLEDCYSITDILDDIEEDITSNSPGSICDWTYDYHDDYDLIVLRIYTLGGIDLEDIEEMIKIYLKEKNLPEMEEVILEKLLPKMSS